MVRRRPEAATPIDPLAWSLLHWDAQLYVGAVIAAGTATFAALFPSAWPPPALFLALLATACVTSTWKVNLPIAIASSSTLSVSYAANLTALLLLGPRYAVIVAIVGVWMQCTYNVKRPYPLYRTVFSAGAEAITMAATGFVYHRLGGPTPPLDAFGLARPLVGAIATYFVVNTSLVAGAIALSSERTFLRVWRDDFLWSGASFVVAGSAGALAAIVIARGEEWKAVLLLAPVYLTYRTYQLFVGRLEDQARHMAEMRLLHQGTVEALKQARQAEQAEQTARADAERANRLKDDFLAIVSHELRTPLNAILGWAEMLRGGRLDQSRRERAFEAIYVSARRQARLIDDLLDVSRIMSGKLRLDRGPVDLNDVVRDAVHVEQPAADSKHVRLTTHTDESIGVIQGDSARLQQVVGNLLSNAVKFTPAGGSVHVLLRRVDDVAELVVRDTGEGIAAEFLPAIFEPFRQADGSTTRVHAGLGLGLSIVKHLVEAHHGTITAESAGAGHGATLTARFPIDAAWEARRAEPPARAHRLSTAEVPSLDGISVLVVDDDQDGRQVVAEYLTSHDAVVRTAASAAEAYAVLEREHVDVMLADIAMPGEDGYALIRRIRAGAVPARAAIPAAALTAFAREEDRQLALHAGFQMHLAKPIDPLVVISAVASLARSKQQTIN